MTDATKRYVLHLTQLTGIRAVLARADLEPELREHAERMLPIAEEQAAAALQAVREEDVMTMYRRAKAALDAWTIGDGVAETNHVINRAPTRLEPFTDADRARIRARLRGDA